MPDFYLARWIAGGLLVAASAGVAIWYVSQRPEAGYTAAIVILTALMGIANFLRAKPRVPQVRFSLHNGLVAHVPTSLLHAIVGNPTGQTISPADRAHLTGPDGLRVRAIDAQSSHPTNSIGHGTSAQYVWDAADLSQRLGDRRELYMVLDRKLGEPIREPVPESILKAIRGKP